MWPFEIPARRSNRLSPKTWYMRHKILFVAGPERRPNGLVHLGQQYRVGGRVDRGEGQRRGTQPVVADSSRAALLPDQPGQLGTRVAGDLGEVPKW